MLPLRNLFRSLPIGLSFFAFASCSVRSETDLAIIKTLDESIENSNKRLNASTTDIMGSFQNKLYEFESKERAQVWFSIAQKVQIVSKDAFDQIQKIKSSYLNNRNSKFNEEDILKVYDCIVKYKNELLLIDSKLTHDYQSYLKMFTKNIDSSSEHQQVLLKSYFSDATISGAIAILTKLQNNIKFNEEGMITLCHEYSTPLCGMGMIMIAALVVQNTNVLQEGDELEITAGLASINAYQKPEVTFYNRSIQLNDVGLAVYKLRAPAKPGKYYVPVKIVYTDQEGRKQSIKKEVEYTVANIQKQ